MSVPEEKKDKSVYMIAFVDINDLDKYSNDYGANVAPLVMKHGGMVLSITDTGNVKEGTFPPGRIVIIEFPSMEHADTFYSDPEYQPLIRIRQKLATSILGFFPKGLIGA